MNVVVDWISSRTIHILINMANKNRGNLNIKGRPEIALKHRQCTNPRSASPSNKRHLEAPFNSICNDTHVGWARARTSRRSKTSESDVGTRACVILYQGFLTHGRYGIYSLWCQMTAATRRRRALLLLPNSSPTLKQTLAKPTDILRYLAGVVHHNGLLAPLVCC
jgi:hypothetical protein